MLRTNAERPGGLGAQKDGWTPRLGRSASNSHLHIPMAVAIAAAFLIVVVIPIARTQANQRNSPPAPLAGAGDGLSESLRLQAAGVTAALAGVQQGNGSGGAASISPPLGKGLFPQSLLSAAAILATKGIFVTPDSQAALMMTRSEPVSFTVHEDGFSSTHNTKHLTVGQALASQGVRLEEGDFVSPAADSLLSPGTHVYVHHAIGVRLVVAGSETRVKTRGQTVGEVLAQAGIGLQPMDRVKPGISKQIKSDMTIKVTTVRDVTAVVEELVPPGSIVNYDAEVAKGRILLDQAGEPGSVRREYLVRQINGRETKRELVSESYTPPTDEVVRIGTYVKPAAAPAPAPVVAAAVTAPENPQCARSLNVYATWYSAASAGGSGTTATGTAVYKGIVAVDPRVIPLGTRMYIPGYGYGIAADTGGSIIGNHIDLGYGPDDVKDWRTRWVDICLL